jgi:hypothetical protein
LPQRQPSRRASVEVAPQEAVVWSAEIQRRLRRIVDDRSAMLPREREDAENSPYARLVG